MHSSPGVELIFQLGAAAWGRLAEGASQARRRRPYMKVKETAIIEEILTRLKPGRCLEWGSGYSTLWFSRLLDKDASWRAIEHDREWAVKVLGMKKDQRVTVAHIAPNRNAWSDAHNDGAPGDLKDYIDYPSRFGKYDFILIDGRARAGCLEKAPGLVRDGGVIVLHDANRRYYLDGIPQIAGQALFLDGRRDEGGLWISRAGGRLEQVLDVEGHKAVWKAYEMLGILHPRGDHRL